MTKPWFYCFPNSLIMWLLPHAELPADKHTYLIYLFAPFVSLSWAQSGFSMSSGPWWDAVFISTGSGCLCPYWVFSCEGMRYFFPPICCCVVDQRPCCELCMLNSRNFFIFDLRVLSHKRVLARQAAFLRYSLSLSPSIPPPSPLSLIYNNTHSHIHTQVPWSKIC